MHPSKRHNGKRLTLYSPRWEETTKGIYRHIERSSIFHLEHEDGTVSVFARDEWIIVDCVCRMVPVFSRFVESNN